MTTPGNVFAGSLLGRSALFGVVLGVAVYAIGLRLELWQMGRGNTVILLIFVGAMLLLPAYEKLAGLRPADLNQQQLKPPLD